MLFETYSSKYNRNTNMSDGTYYISKSREFHLIHNLLILEDDKKDNRNPLYRSTIPRFDGGLSFLVRLHCQLLVVLLYKINQFVENQNITINDPILLRLEKHFLFISELINMYIFFYIVLKGLKFLTRTCTRF
jgi:hypothetical protein